MRRKAVVWVDSVDGGIMSTESAHLPYLLGSMTRETGPSMNFVPPSTPSPSFWDSMSKAKRVFESNVILAKGTPSNDVRSSVSVTRKASRTFGLSRIEERTLSVTSWRKTMSGRLNSLRISPRMCLALAMGREEKASMFHVCERKVGSESKLLCHLARCVSRRYWCPESGG